MATEPDYSNPIHRANLWLEELKYGPGARAVEGVTWDEMREQLDTTIRAAGMASKMSVEQVMEAADFYGRSFSRQLGLDNRFAASVWLDAYMTALLTAGGVGKNPPPPTKGEG